VTSAIVIIAIADLFKSSKQLEVLTKCQNFEKTFVGMELEVVDFPNNFGNFSALG